jgi:N6-L-threonylcarbamoyladenine synthase
MKTLAIETSCDDTSLALVSEENGFFVCEKMLTDTQKFHDDYGWVVPEMASRAHADRILPLFQRFLAELERTEKDFSDQIDCISVTVTPWLPWSLMIGKIFAHMLGEYYNKPVVEVNHLYGHVLSLLLDRSRQVMVLPMVVLSASGGHTDVYLVAGCGLWDTSCGLWEKVWEYYITKLWGSRDDAAGEVFDKVARLLGGPYPGGRWIGEQASSRKLQVESVNWITVSWDENKYQKIQKWPRSPYHFKRIMLEEGSFDFSFSGMKSQAYTFIERMKNNNPWDLTFDQINEISYEFQEAITDVLSKKLLSAVAKFDAKTIWLVGGVSANMRLREKLGHIPEDKKILLPMKFEYCTDNAAMIGVVGLVMNF